MSNNTKTHLEGQAHIETGMGEQERDLGYIEIADIDVISNPRSESDEDAFKALCESVKRFGVTTPILVAKSTKDGRYNLFAGGRRFLAAKEVGLSTIPAQIASENESATDGDRLSRALVENLVREDMTPIDEAVAFAQLQQSESLTEQGVAKLLSVPVQKVKDRLALLTLPSSVQDMVDKAEITLQNAATLKPIAKQSPRVAEALAERVVNGSQSARALDDDPAAALRSLADVEIAPGDPDEDLFILPFGERDSVNANEVVSRLQRIIAADVVSDEAAKTRIEEAISDTQGAISKLDDELAVVSVSADAVDRARAFGGLIEYSQGAHKRSGVLTDPDFAADWLKATVTGEFGELTSEQLDEQARKEVECEIDAVQSEKKKRQHEREEAELANKYLGDRLRRQFEFKSELTMDMAITLCGLVLDSYGKDIARIVATVRDDFTVVDSSVGMSGGKRRVTTRLPGPDEAMEKINQNISSATSPEQLLSRTFGLVAASVFADRRALPESRRGHQFPLPINTGNSEEIPGMVSGALWDAVAPLLTKERAEELEEIFDPSDEGRPDRDRLARNTAIDLEAAATDQQMVGETDPDPEGDDVPEETLEDIAIEDDLDFLDTTENDEEAAVI